MGHRCWSLLCECPCSAIMCQASSISTLPAMLYACSIVGQMLPNAAKYCPMLPKLCPPYAPYLLQSLLFFPLDQAAILSASGLPPLFNEKMEWWGSWQDSWHPDAWASVWWWSSVMVQSDGSWDAEAGWSTGSFGPSAHWSIDQVSDASMVPAIWSQHHVEGQRDSSSASPLHPSASLIIPNAFLAAIVNPSPHFLNQ